MMLVCHILIIGRRCFIADLKVTDLFFSTGYLIRKELFVLLFQPLDPHTIVCNAANRILHLQDLIPVLFFIRLQLVSRFGKDTVKTAIQFCDL